MSTKLYVRDVNGNILSHDNKLRFKVLTGTQIYQYFESEESKNKFFYKTKDIEGNPVIIECTEEEYLHSEKERKHFSYLRRCEEESGLEKVTFNFFIRLGDETEEFLETIEDETSNTEEIFDKQEMYRNLNEAIKSLSEEEYDLICALFLLKRPMTERQYSEKTGIPQPTVNYKKKKILEKIKNFL